MKTVGLIGYFGSNAYSDDFIQHVTEALIKELDSDITFDANLLNRCGSTGKTDARYLNSFDLLIHCGGSLLGKCTHFPVRDIQLWHDKVHTPLMMFGPGYRYEPDKEPLSPHRRRRLQHLFDKSEIISVRGWRTIQHLEENGVNVSKIDSVGDPVTACNFELNRTPKYLMGNVRCMSPMEIQHANTYEIHTVMAEIYDWLIDEYDLPLQLISFKHDQNDDNDYTGGLLVREKMRHKDRVTVLRHPSHISAFKSIGNAVFWFGQRLHPTVFAGIQGIPFVGLEYQFEKMIDWMSTVKVDNYIHTQEMSLDGFIEKFNQVPTEMSKLEKNIPPNVKEIRGTVKKIVEYL